MIGKITSLFAENTEKFKESLQNVSNTVQGYINIVLGVVMGALALWFIITAIFVWIKIGSSDTSQKRAEEIKRLKWIGVAILAVIIIWSISGILTKAFSDLAPSSNSLETVLIHNTNLLNNHLVSNLNF
ncbi:hypothetical protein GE118_04185 [Mycoplasma sp. NEAQ87857]|uniref:Mbov_0395 family pilin-like conjugal transfer protein n=1 Tax=Mycoplasma sp. NEAQ87857 TaxID=2683967 RepID=UPI001316828A|nr:hypothetical protein [Mycoplasma sp. NEAQ87857]QGZ97975.1 hypothetical protein GE118_04185 [Mycoplasma sp. NEAQ87857]